MPIIIIFRLTVLHAGMSFRNWLPNQPISAQALICPSFLQVHLNHFLMFFLAFPCQLNYIQLKNSHPFFHCDQTNEVFCSTCCRIYYRIFYTVWLFSELILSKSVLKAFKVTHLSYHSHRISLNRSCSTPNCSFFTKTWNITLFLLHKSS